MMNLFSRFIKRRPTSARLLPTAVVAATSQSLTTLPTEIIRQIISFLPLYNVVALTLTCKALTAIIGTRSWNELKRDFAERARFLGILQRDLPIFWAESKLRAGIPSSYPQNFATGLQPRYRTRNEFDIWSPRFQYGVQWPHVVLTLKNNTLGSDHGIALDKFQYQKTITFKATSDPDSLRVYPASVKFKVDARIVAGHLLLRCVYRLSSDKVRRLKLHNLVEAKLDICRHVSTEFRNFSWFDNTLANTMRPRSYNYNSGPAGCETCGDESYSDTNLDELFPKTPQTISHHCSFCMTEYHVTTESRDPEANLVVTTWHNLGTGKFSPDAPIYYPAERIWKAFTGSDKVQDCKFHRFKPNCVRDAFELGKGEFLHDFRG